MPTLPMSGSPVTVWLEGRWLSGVVVESSEASGEFLVEFDDEGEVEAWISVSQPWKPLGEEEEVVVEDASAADEQPALPLPSKAEPSTAATVASDELPPAPPAAAEARAPPDEVDMDERSLLLAEFEQLHSAALRADGSLESSRATCERFRILHEAVAAVDAG